MYYSFLSSHLLYLTYIAEIIYFYFGKHGRTENTKERSRISQDVAGTTAGHKLRLTMV
jgi:hypothetical protein